MLRVFIACTNEARGRRGKCSSKLQDRLKIRLCFSAIFKVSAASCNIWTCGSRQKRGCERKAPRCQYLLQTSQMPKRKSTEARHESINCWARFEGRKLPQRTATTAPAAGSAVAAAADAGASTTISSRRTCASLPEVRARGPISNGRVKSKKRRAAARAKPDEHRD